MNPNPSSFCWNANKSVCEDKKKIAASQSRREERTNERKYPPQSHFLNAITFFTTHKPFSRDRNRKTFQRLAKCDANADTISHLDCDIMSKSAMRTASNSKQIMMSLERLGESRSRGDYCCKLKRVSSYVSRRFVIRSPTAETRGLWGLLGECEDCFDCITICCIIWLSRKPLNGIFWLTIGSFSAGVPNKVIRLALENLGGLSIRWKLEHMLTYRKQKQFKDTFDKL